MVLTTTQVGLAAAGPAQQQTGQRHSVTLITGDQVVVDDAGQAKSVKPGKGRETMMFSTRYYDGRLFVVPRDALPLVASGRLDRRLFDITTLRESGYDDSRRADIPLIVSYAPGVSRAQVRGTATTMDLASVNAVAATAAKTGAAWQALSGNGIRKVWLDGIRKSTLDRSTAQIGAPTAWQAGYTGDGVKVAVLDTGVDQTHPDLVSREIAERNFTDTADSVDRIGHGTHVASIVSGTGPKYRGVAHGARILDGKVIGDDGYGRDSWTVAGMQWAVAEGAKVVNLSLGAIDTQGIDPVEEAVNTLSAQHGTLFVVSAGNTGPRDSSIDSPGSADAALTVGAVDRTDVVPSFSGRGPRAGDAGVKPDITAPGVGIIAAKAAEGQIGGPVEPGYVTLTGTSMAAPHVAGAAAILAQMHPDWTGERIKATLTAAARPTPGVSVLAQGSGRVDVARALTQSITTAPTSLSLGTQRWPHDDDQAVRKSLTYTNSGQNGVTLDLTLQATGPDGSPAPAGLLTVEPARVTVPAGGQATVTVSGDTRASSLDGVYAGMVTATGGGTAVVTPLSINREPESYDLTIRHIGLDGSAPPTDVLDTILFGFDSREIFFPTEPDGTVVLRLPKGRYVLESSLVTESLHWLVYPALDLTRDMVVDLDYRLAKPTRITPFDRTARLQMGALGYLRRGAERPFGSAWTFGGADTTHVHTAHLGPALPPNELTVQMSTQWLASNGDFHALAWYLDGRMPTGFTKAVKRKDVAHVRATFGTTVPGSAAYRSVTAYPKSGLDTQFLASIAMPLVLPGERHEYYTTESTKFVSQLEQMKPDGWRTDIELVSPMRGYVAGRTYHESFNRGVFGPALPDTDSWWDGVVRRGNEIGVRTPMWGDGGGNMGILYPLDSSGRTALYRDGEKIGEWSFDGFGGFRVPPEPAQYRLAIEGVRSGIWDVSTRISVAWTFPSAAPAGPEPVVLPISTVRYTPALDAANSAPAGRLFIVPVIVQPQRSNTPVLPKKLTVEASYDGGSTWRQAVVVANSLAILSHPANATAVSLRTKATDRAGNTVEQTTINAYKLR